VSLIEAQAAGVPVVAMDVGGTTAVIDDGMTGRVVPRGEEDRMAEAIDELLDHPELSERFARAGRASSLSRFSIERLVRDIEHLYERLLNERNLPTP
jgi:glycosyltransferase involved in cell wall biosynthesis